MAQRRSRVCHWCSYHILTPYVIYYWTDARQHGIYLFYIITKQITTHKAFVYFKIFQHNVKAGLCPLWRRQKKPFDVIYDLYKMKKFHWLLCASKNCDWSRKITPLSNLTRASLLVKWKLTVKAELNCEIHKSWRKCWKNQVSFCHRSGPVSWKGLTLPWKLQELKSTLGKLGSGQPRGHMIRVLNELKGA